MQLGRRTSQLMGQKYIYKITQNISNSTICFSNQKKAESLAQTFEHIHHNAHSACSPIQEEIEQKAAHITNSHVQLKFKMHSINIIKILPNNKALGPDKIINCLPETWILPHGLENVIPGSKPSTPPTFIYKLQANKLAE